MNPDDLNAEASLFEVVNHWTNRLLITTTLDRRDHCEMFPVLEFPITFDHQAVKFTKNIHVYS